jgi:hypothetical protein
MNATISQSMDWFRGKAHSLNETVKKIFQRLRNKRMLADYGDTYLGVLKSEFRTLTPQSDSEVALADVAREIIDKWENPRQDISWDDIYLLEKITLRIQPNNRLTQRACNLRAKYRDLVGQKAYDSYLQSNPPDPQTGDKDALRGDLEQLLSEFHWQYAINMARETMRDRISSKVLFILGIIVLTAVLLPVFVSDYPSLFVLVVFMGALGGFVSTQNRLQSSRDSLEPIKELTMLDRGVFNIFLSPISGAVFASILFLMFAGGFLKGDLFPELGPSGGSTDTAMSEAAPDDAIVDRSNENVLTSQADQGEDGIPSLKEFADATVPITNGDFAKVLIWSFIAGFAERFVPDALNRIAAIKEGKD